MTLAAARAFALERGASAMPVEKAGLLVKASSGHFKYFCLQGGELRYYRHDAAHEPAHVMKLYSAEDTLGETPRVAPATLDAKARDRAEKMGLGDGASAFEIIMPKRFFGRTQAEVFICELESERDDWLVAIQACIATRPGKMAMRLKHAHGI